MADIAARLKDWSTNEASNAPAGSTTIGTGLDDNLRQTQATVRADLAFKGADIAVAATVDLGAITGSSHDITGLGTGTIVSFGTVSAGIWKDIQFNATCTIKYSASAMILPSDGSDITAVPGDCARALSLGSGNWRVQDFTRASGSPLGLTTAVLTGTFNTSVLTGVFSTSVLAGVFSTSVLTGVFNTAVLTATVSTASLSGTLGGFAASQAEVEAVSSNTKFVTPGRQHFHPGSAKAWAVFDTAGNIQTSYNVSSITDTGVGDMTVNYTTALSAIWYPAVITIQAQNGTIGLPCLNNAANSGVPLQNNRVHIYCFNVAGTAGQDPNYWSVVVFGDIA